MQVLLQCLLPGAGLSAECDGVAFHLPGRFLSSVAVVGSTMSILKSEYKCLLGGAVSFMGVTTV